jgi:hypothetical protein
LQAERDIILHNGKALGSGEREARFLRGAGA